MENLFDNTNVVFFEENDFDINGNLQQKSSDPVFIGILSTSCPWCHRAAPELAKLSKSKDIIVGVLVDSLTGSKLLNKVGARGVPTFLLFENGELTSVYEGNRDAASFKKFILG